MTTFESVFVIRRMGVNTMSLYCSKCGSEKIIPWALMKDQGQYSDGELEVAVLKNPNAWVFQGAVTSKLTANICGECGYTELFVVNPAALYQAYMNQRS
jgi:predicted nucleic-acid-binding Zn-ribbon protein